MAPHLLNGNSALPSRKLILPTKQHYLKVKSLLKSEYTSSIIYMKGKPELTRDNTDIELEFRQESYFFYLTGVEEPNFQVVVDLEKDEIYLITPDVSVNDVFWKGPAANKRELMERYDIDEVISESDLPQLVQTLAPETIFVLDNKMHYMHALELITSSSIRSRIDTQLLLPAMDEARLIKFSWEIDIIRQVMHASSQAHIALMQQFQPGMTEAHLAAVFRWNCALNQVYRQAYLPIVASGSRAATLHHFPNNDQHIINDPHSLVLVDAGGEKLCYGSDITRTFPVQGVFSDEAKAIYSIVLKMQQVVLSKLRPGIYWQNMQQLATEILCKELVRLGILVGDINVLMEQSVPCAFYFHGLGHALGLDVHDVGGKETSKDDPTVSQFLLDRPLEKNMVITIEPGLYFNDYMLDIWTQCPGYQCFFNMEILDQYRHLGGVRIEDTVVITEDGHENLTIVPKEIDEIEALMMK
ncbi:Creatinase/aminopeptidase [Rhizopus microsporus var. microsporus]|uniref:Creatinase/aminopeptidase n=2 Tax=Rhizopus microsporus TaxID=58291 RepID=A0A2G4SH97_RHIZD|nr:Creatinase/aminopeptidase [Rhizopus microsporus ATCC 52813]ORE10474.1 Creatinase/aminopeptidase [Rhizopus microsporus var. microsporus]PHZ08148.1 Creatinase/aminopeptidase [Rhizopus microsporus ATCC 52813]